MLYNLYFIHSQNKVPVCEVTVLDLQIQMDAMICQKSPSKLVVELEFTFGLPTQVKHTMDLLVWDQPVGKRASNTLYHSSVQTVSFLSVFYCLNLL